MPDAAYLECAPRHRPRRAGHADGRPQLRVPSIAERVHGRQAARRRRRCERELEARVGRRLRRSLARRATTLLSTMGARRPRQRSSRRPAARSTRTRSCHRALDTVGRRGGSGLRSYGGRRLRVHAAPACAASTDRGGTVTAEHAVLATGYEVARLLPELPMRLHSSFALVSEPIPSLDSMFPDGLLFWDLDDPYLYGRTTDDGRLLIGGRDETYRDPLRRRRALPAKTRALAAAVPQRFPAIGDDRGGVRLVRHVRRDTRRPRLHRLALALPALPVRARASAATASPTARSPPSTSPTRSRARPRPTARIFDLERSIRRPSG